jgi:tetratricopeptide (TPR) repeat protein
LNERWQRIKQLFGDANVLAPEARGAFLDEACDGDADLRTEVESLLAHSREGAIVDMPAAAYVTGSAFRAGAEQWIGQRLGPYELTALLGHGGMGEVYRARRVDAEYDKEVAIKLVPAGYQAAYVLQRLRTERQILATLEHPNIARLIDGGASAQGIPYLVMELVEGKPIDTYCAPLPIEKRLDLFREVCGAVSYAHQRLVVHRDLKPGNILVTSEGQVKLLDFGIAKLLRPSASDITQPPATLMQTFTPGFASPEQVLGRPITTASDVYSLGVLLYLLLSGRSPYRGSLDTTQDAIREICETEPEPPGVSADLDAICLRALRKEPSRRYVSVDQLSEDVHRYLRGLPVIARGDHLSYRAGKFLRRRRLELAAAVVVVLTLVGGLLFSLREARIAEAQRARAERHFQSVRDLADTFMFQVHDAVAPLPGSTEARGLLVDTALKYLNTLATEAGDDRELRLDLAQAYIKVGDVQGQPYGASIGKQPEAVASYRKSTELADGVLAADPNYLPALRVLTASLRAESRLLLQLGETAAAVAASRRSVETNDRLMRLAPDRGSRLQSGRTHVSHAITMDFAGHEGEAREHIKMGVRILADLSAEFPDDLVVAGELATAYGASASTVLGPQRDEQALAAAVSDYRKSLAADQRVFDRTPADKRGAEEIRSVFAGHANVANMLFHTGDFAEAMVHCEKAQELLAQLRVDAKNAQTDVDDAMLVGHRARILIGLGRHEEAERTALGNVTRLRVLTRDSDNLHLHFHLGLSQQLLGSLAERRGDCKRAHDWYAEALPHFERVTAAVTLDFTDMSAIELTKAGLNRCGAQLRSPTALIPRSSALVR